MRKAPKKVLKKRGIALLLIFAGLISMMYGIHRHEHVTVGKKAGIICLECIGIG